MTASAPARARVIDPWEAPDFVALAGVAQRLGAPAVGLLGMLLSESDGYPGPALMHGHADHHVNAVGLNQILTPSLPDIGWRGRWEDYEALGVTQQLVYVERWLRMRPGPKDTAARLYLANFLPGYWQHGGDPTFILCGLDTHPQWYLPNWGAFDPWLTKPRPAGIVRRGEKGYITVDDLRTRIARKLAEPRGVACTEAMTEALRAQPPAEPPAPVEPTDEQVLQALTDLRTREPDIEVRADPPDFDKMGAKRRV